MAKDTMKMSQETIDANGNWCYPDGKQVQISKNGTAAAYDLALDSAQTIEKPDSKAQTVLFLLTDQAASDIEVTPTQLKEYRNQMQDMVKVAHIPNAGRSPEEIEELLTTCAEAYHDVIVVMSKPQEPGHVSTMAARQNIDTMHVGQMARVIKSTEHGCAFV